MPSLLLFAVSRMVVLDKDDGSPTIVSILPGIVIPLSKEQMTSGLDRDAVVPLEWAAVSYYKYKDDEGDNEKQFHQKIEIIDPEGLNRGGSEGEFRRVGHSTHAIKMQSYLFPIGVRGEYKVRLYLREKIKDSDSEWSEWKLLHEFPVDVHYVPQERVNTNLPVALPLEGPVNPPPADSQ